MSKIARQHSLVNCIVRYTDATWGNRQGKVIEVSWSLKADVHELEAYIVGNGFADWRPIAHLTVVSRAAECLRLLGVGAEPDTGEEDTEILYPVQGE